MDALVELARRCALVALPLGTRRIDDQRTRTLSGPVVVRLEVGAGDGDRIPTRIGAAVHDPRSGGHDGAQLAGRLEYQPARFGSDHITGHTGRQRVRWEVELLVLQNSSPVSAKADVVDATSDPIISMRTTTIPLQVSDL